MAIRPKLNRVWTSNNSVARRDPGDAKYLQGWVAEIPTYQVLNYLQYKIDTTMLAQAERGIFEWGDDVSYGVGSLAWDETNKTIYVCTVTNPSRTLRPSANSAQWSPSSIQVSRANYDSIVAAINAHIADITSNPHRVTAAQIGAYNKSELDAIVANYRAMVQAHVTDYNNPHRLTAIQVGAVPVTGGTYTGPVTMPSAYFNESKTAQILRGDGLWLKNGNYLIGINDTTGFAETGTTSSKSRIVTELNFPDVKAAQEPEYAVPSPTFEMPLIKSVNIIRGFGTFDTQSLPFTYLEFTGGAITFESLPGLPLATARASSELPRTGGTTVCADFYRVSRSETADGNWQINFGIGDFSIIVGYDGTILSRYRVSNGGLSTTVGTVALPARAIGEWFRVAATLTASQLKLYVNGVLIRTFTVSGISDLDKGPFITRWNLVGATTQSTISMKSFRIWSVALSDKQVSTL